MKPKLSNAHFRSHLDVKPEGSVTLGFLDVTLHVEPVEIEIADLVVRLTTEGQPSVAAPRRMYQNRNGEQRSRAALRFDDRTYDWLVRSVFALPAVQREVERALRALEERKSASAQAPAQDEIPF